MSRKYSRTCKDNAKALVALVVADENFQFDKQFGSIRSSRTNQKAYDESNKQPIIQHKLSHINNKSFKKSLSLEERLKKILIQDIVEKSGTYFCLTCGSTFEDYCEIQSHRNKCVSQFLMMSYSSSSPWWYSYSSLKRRRIGNSKTSTFLDNYLQNAIKVIPESSFNNLHGTIYHINSVDGYFLKTNPKIRTVNKVKLNLSGSWKFEEVWKGGWDETFIENSLSWKTFAFYVHLLTCGGDLESASSWSVRRNNQGGKRRRKRTTGLKSNTTHLYNLEDNSMPSFISECKTTNTSIRVSNISCSEIIVDLFDPSEIFIKYIIEDVLSRVLDLKSGKKRGRPTKTIKRRRHLFSTKKRKRCPLHIENTKYEKEDMFSSSYSDPPIFARKSSPNDSVLIYAKKSLPNDFSTRSDQKIYSGYKCSTFNEFASSSSQKDEDAFCSIDLTMINVVDENHLKEPLDGCRINEEDTAIPSSTLNVYCHPCVLLLDKDKSFWNLGTQKSGFPNDLRGMRILNGI
ncbi:unnamed protein product [Lepeophtheirus salmonis]|uniref:(salmon louse) hypothetical protein n=1 Tax=Lepeophtheirus salmonis TaxID=72036 RepID=A0A7R8CM90_LEPSM|nr:unnamed protein product [Lepeophtheirus salmonis]CAF2819358.1 unnamed protein product [Lepeophtheirus salmonis]